VGEHPTLAIDRVAAVGRRAGYTCTRVDETVAIADFSVPLSDDVDPAAPPLTAGLADVLYVVGSRMDVGTRVDLFGHIEPALVHAVLQALAKAPPWMRGPIWA
jgi:hypothetical protein